MIEGLLLFVGLSAFGLLLWNTRPDAAGRDRADLGLFQYRDAENTPPTPPKAKG